MTMRNAPEGRAEPESEMDRVIAEVRRKLAGMRFGEVRITVQDGYPVQIDKLEKTRLR